MRYKMPHLLPVQLAKDQYGKYVLLDCHNDEIATFNDSIEIAEMRMLVELLNLNARKDKP